MPIFKAQVILNTFMRCNIYCTYNPQLTQFLVTKLEICNNKYLTVGNEMQLAEDTIGR